MKKWIRWQGLVAFGVVVAVVAVFWFLILDGLVRHLIEKTGTSIVGAEVDLKKADVKLFPLGITLTGLEVTNPQAPGTNSFECGRIAFSLDSLNLLRRKVIINEMAVEGMRFDTERKRPGTVKKPPEKKKTEEKQTLFALPSKTPDAKTILQQEKLESPQVIDATRADIQKKKGDWQQRMDELPNKAKIEAYKSRIDKIRQSSKGNLLGMAGQLSEVKAITKDIEQDLDRVKKARTAFTNDLGAAKNAVDRAERAPMDDARRLTDKYSISGAKLQNMSRLLFGDKMASWVQSGLLWYNRLQPMLERTKAKKGNVKVVKPVRGRGVDVRFKEARPLPDFLIAKTAVSAQTTAGALAGTIKNITTDQDVLGIPLTFSLTGEKLQAAKSLAVTGALNHIRPANPEDTVHVSMLGYRMQDLVFSDNKDLPIAMQDGLVDFELHGTMTNLLKAKFTMAVNSARMKVGGETGSNPLVSSVRSALSKVSRFSLTADISGTVDNYTMNISSDLDNVLKNAVGSAFRDQSARLEKELQAAIQEKTGAQLKSLKDSFGGLNEQGGKLDGIQNQLNGLLQDATKSAGGGKLRFPR